MLGIDSLSHAPISSLDLGPSTTTPAIRVATVPAQNRVATPIAQLRVLAIDAQDRTVALPKSVRERSP